MGDLELPDALRDELRAAWHRYIDLKEDSHDQPPRQPAHRAYLRRPTRAPVRAWTDAAEMARWYSPADGMTLSIDALEVRVGGRYQATSGMPGETPFVEAGEYRKVEPGRLLEFDMSLARGGTVFSRTRCTVEFLDRCGG